MSRVSITSDKFVFNNVKLVEQIIVLELIVQYRDSHRFEEFKQDQKDLQICLKVL